MTRCSITGIGEEQVKALGVTNVKKTRYTGIMFAELTNEQVDLLRSRGATVESVRTVKAESIRVPQPQPGVQLYTPKRVLSIAGIDELRRITIPPLHGFGFNVAILDTGVRETHEQVAGRVIYRKNYTSDILHIDGYDHGTAVACALIATAPLCGVLDLKVINNEGEGTTEQAIDAIDDCIGLWETNPGIAPVVINLSVGAVDPHNVNDPLRLACRAALANRIWVVVACGNSGPEEETIVTPAVERYVLSVGSAHPETLQVSEFSSRGPTAEGAVKPDVVFFGENLKVASSVSDDAVVGKSGTSFAAPFVSGIAVLMIEGIVAYTATNAIGSNGDSEARISMEQIINDYLIRMCVKPGNAPLGKDNSYGYGIPMGQQTARVIAGELVTGLPLTEYAMAITSVGIVGMVGKLALRRS